MADIDPELIGAALGLFAHDLRNPLAVLHSNLGFLGSALTPNDRDVRDAIEDGLMSCDGLSHVIENIELFAQTLRPQERVPRSPLMTSELLSEVASRCASLAKSYGRFIELPPVTGSNDFELLTHRELLSRALGNLVRNSVTHAAASSPIRLSVSKPAEHVEIVVEDQGAPVAPELRAQVFTLAGQVAAKSNMGEGRYSRGLGLYCARIAAELAGASVDILDGTEGEGNRFVLKIPAAA